MKIVFIDDHRGNDDDNDDNDGFFSAVESHGHDVIDETKNLLHNYASNYNSYGAKRSALNQDNPSLSLIQNQGETAQCDNMTDRPSGHQEEEIIIVSEDDVTTVENSTICTSASVSVSTSTPITTWQKIQSSVDEYISNLKLPFEILIMTCMFVLLRGCIPILVQLLPTIVKSHKTFFLELSGIMILICLLLWCLTRTNNKSHGHVGLWTGSALRH